MTTWLLSIILVGTAERAHQSRVVASSQHVKIGATPGDVLDILGPPSAQFEARDGLALWLFGPRPRQWMYGTTVNLHSVVVPDLPFPNPLPINLRIFGYAHDDLVIDWSPENFVTNIKRPTIPVAREADALLDSLNFVRDLAQLILRATHAATRPATDGSA